MPDTIGPSRITQLIPHEISGVTFVRQLIPCELLGVINSVVFPSRDWWREEMCWKVVVQKMDELVGIWWTLGRESLCGGV